MKRIHSFVLLFAVSFFIASCELQDEVTSSVNTEQIKIKHFTKDVSFPTIVSNNYTTTNTTSSERVENLPTNSNLDFLEFKTKEDFRTFASMPALKIGFIQDWKAAYNKFYSLEDEINTIFYNYDNLLDNVEKKYENSSNIDANTEKEIDEQIENLLKPYSFISYKKEDGIDRKTYAIGFDYLLNKDGIVKVEGKIYQYSYDFVKVIGDGDMSKISLLNQINETNEGLNIYVNKVWHNKEEGSPTGRIENQLSSCTSTKDNYRTIAYEEQAIEYDYRYSEGFTHYFIKLRSLKKKTLWWGNHKTGFLRSQGSFTAAFTGGITPTYTSAVYTGTYHTWYTPLYSSGLVRGLTDNQFRASVFVISSNHTASGKNGTGCSFGK